MFSSPSEPQYMPCPECGASLARTDRDDHVCEQERWLKYQLLQLRDETELFEAQLSAYLESPSGRFELWDAERRRRDRRG
jgi:hypothetical protein